MFMSSYLLQTGKVRGKVCVWAWQPARLEVVRSFHSACPWSDQICFSSFLMQAIECSNSWMLECFKLLNASRSISFTGEQKHILLKSIRFTLFDNLVERRTLRVKCLPQEHIALSAPARAKTRTARSWVQCANCKVTTPSSPWHVRLLYFCCSNEFLLYDDKSAPPTKEIP